MRISPASNISSEANSSTSAQNVSEKTDAVERMENPFRNLHPKIYYRQKNATSKKVIIDNKRAELKPDINSSPLSNNVNLKTDHSIKQSNSTSQIRANDDSVVVDERKRREENGRFVEGRFCRETNLHDQDTLADFNQRNMSLSNEASEGENVTFPLLVLPRAVRENTRSIKSLEPSSESNKGILPPIKDVPSFISLVQEEDIQKKKGRRKRIRHTQATRFDDDRLSWWNTYSTYPTAPTAREDLASESMAGKYTQGHRPDTRRLWRGSQAIIKTTNYTKNADDCNTRLSRVTSQTLPAWTCSHYDDASEKMNRDYMILKAKIHRSSFI